MTPEAEFGSELEIFRREEETGTQFFYAHIAIHAVAADCAPVLEYLNRTPLFWNTVAGALQTSALITLGRIFDQRSDHNIDRVLRIAQDNPQIFTKAALRLRKQGSDREMPSWLSEYLRNAYEPTAGDFRRLRAHVRSRRKLYEKVYRDIRHKWFAHRELSDSGAAALFAKTKVSELQQLFIFLSSLHNALWQLFVNGQKPRLRPQRYSVKRMRDKPFPDGRRAAVQEQITHETEQILTEASKRQ